MLIVITSEEGTAQEAEYLNHFFMHGLQLVHVRKPFWNDDQLNFFLKEIDPSFLERITLHKNPSLVSQWGVGGVHIPLNDTLDFQGRISSSAHTWEEVSAIITQRDYVFLSPFYDSISKKGYQKQGRLWQRNDWSFQDQVIALGGIQENNLGEIYDLGFKGAAVLGTVWQAVNPLEQVRKLLEIAQCKDQRR